MSDFMYLFRGGSPSGTPEQMQQQMQRWAEWASALGAKGHLRGGDPLDGTGKVLRNRESVTDGPYAEAKDLVGGYMLIEAQDFDSAVELSRDCPIFHSGGSIEIRPVLKLSK